MRRRAEKFIYLLCVIASLLFADGAAADFYSGTAPYRPFGEIEGFNIMENNSDTLKFLHLGVKRTDIVVSVNGKPIRSLASAKKAYAVPTLREIVVLRQHRPVTLSARGRGAK